MPKQKQYNLEQLEVNLDGDLFFDNINLIAYSTDASAYKEKPLAIARPKNREDIKKLIQFARENKTSIIPRTAGTSLAGQVVGNGIIVDVSKYMTRILEVNEKEKWVRIEPGVILDELNIYLKQFGLFFGPETSTSNRCMIGGMLGNNACGAHSLIYGSTRDHTIAVKTILSDGSEVEFDPITKSEFHKKTELSNFEGKIYKSISAILSKEENQQNIRREYPDLSIKRRNTGYAIDLLLETELFSNTDEKFNFSKLLAGSEGTLAFTTEIKLNLVPVPPNQVAVVCAHFETLEDALRANLIALKYNPGAVELMDQTILNLTKGNIEQQKNRFFVKGDPGAILIIEFARNSVKEIDDIANKMKAEMKVNGFGYHFPIIYNNETKKVWNLRKAGLGVLSNVPGDAKPVSVIEDTSVDVVKLPDYIAEFKVNLEKYNLDCVYHAHIGTGELHLRPILNLKDAKDVELFHSVALDTAKLVKKYNGSLSGEHGDGRLRGEFIPLMVGDSNYKLLKDIKQTWDPNNIFNPGKIVDTPPMNSSLRYEIGKDVKEIDTIFDFSEQGGFLKAVEKCNGSGDCRKTEIVGGTMCPSYMATKDENSTTRARANVLRDIISNSKKENPFDSKEIYEVMDLCLSCKACKSECPSSVDVAKLKAEFLQHYYDDNGVPLRANLIANISKINRIGALFPYITNFFMGNNLLAPFFMRTFGFSTNRKMPLLFKTTLKKWSKRHFLKNQPEKFIKTVYLFNDEFTNYNDTEIGIKAIKLLNKLGYKVIIPNHFESGRTYLSKGLIRKARKLALININYLKEIISDNSPLIGIEPSAILAFRDEYPDLTKGKMKDQALKIAHNTFMIDEFLVNEIKAGNISKESFNSEKKDIKLHGHCQQKAIASTDPTKELLSFPENYSVEEIPSGCCGMAGSFGYEKEHYDISMKVGELVLFPEIRKTENDTLISAPGTSCRHQIKDGTNRNALHPVEILYDALNI
jgi:FAD/FMN-containing dehydrogenase/Fe-S oxidoreductase